MRIVEELWHNAQLMELISAPLSMKQQYDPTGNCQRSNNHSAEIRQFY